MTDHSPIRLPFAESRVRASLLVLLAAVAVIPIVAQNPRAPSSNLPTDVSPAIRYSETVEVPRPGKASVRVRVNLGSWRLDHGAGQITIPPQGFYIAELRNGDIVTVIGGNETIRHNGEIWAVAAGQSMVVQIPDSRRQSIMLHVFSVAAP